MSMTADPSICYHHSVLWKQSAMAQPCLSSGPSETVSSTLQQQSSTHITGSAWHGFQPALDDSLVAPASVTTGNTYKVPRYRGIGVQPAAVRTVSTCAASDDGSDSDDGSPSICQQSPSPKRFCRAAPVAAIVSPPASHSAGVSGDLLSNIADTRCVASACPAAEPTISMGLTMTSRWPKSPADYVDDGSGHFTSADDKDYMDDAASHKCNNYSPLQPKNHRQAALDKALVHTTAQDQHAFLNWPDPLSSCGVINLQVTAGQQLGHLLPVSTADGSMVVHSPAISSRDAAFPPSSACRVHSPIKVVQAFKSFHSLHSSRYEQLLYGFQFVAEPMRAAWEPEE
eukprot:jgi/Chrzof1/801/Cz01g29100.t1